VGKRPHEALPTRRNSVRRERRKPTKAELGRITSPGLIIRRVRLSKPKPAAVDDSKRKEGEV
jgi:hypothetical protein